MAICGPLRQSVTDPHPRATHQLTPVTLPLILGSGALRSLIFSDHAKRLISGANERLLSTWAGELEANHEPGPQPGPHDDPARSAQEPGSFR